MLQPEVNRRPITNLLPDVAQKSITLLECNEPHDALSKTWRSLRSPHTEGVILIRPSTSPLVRISEALSQVAELLTEREVWRSEVSSKGSAKEIRDLVTESGIPNALGDRGNEALGVISHELQEMHSAATRMTRFKTCAISIRVERSGGARELFHRDIGTSLFTSLVGPGTLFTTPGNVPPTESLSIDRGQLKNQKLIFSAPTCSTLVARGMSHRSTGAFNPEGLRQGLWHASPGKNYLISADWPVRVVLIVAVPSHKIALPPPSLADWV